MQKISTEHLPKYRREAFHCPRCKVLAPHVWYEIHKSHEYHTNTLIEEVNVNRKSIGGIRYVSPGVTQEEPKEFALDWHLDLSVCSHCFNYTIWENKKVIFPFTTELPEPYEDMPEEVRSIYNEAMGVFKHSPRAAAALLRLAIETMIPQLEEYQIKKSKINTMIGELVKQDVPEHIQQGLDAIRIYGNEGIHPGEIVLNDDQDMVMYLFELINIMVEELITKKKKIKSFYEKLPLGKIQGILNRDKQGSK